jgi:two-component system, chemotaxis family, protein-glutamate methylesterase/glutaminase
VSATRHNGHPFDAVVVVGSQGALDAFKLVLGCLPARFPAAVVFDLHRNDRYGLTERLLERFSAMAVRPAIEGLALEPGAVYVAPCDRQLVVTEERRLSLSVAATVGTGHRHADALLASAARALGPRLIAVVLSGRLDGGARGVSAAKEHGARVLVQDPETAAAPSMPRAALATGAVDFALPPDSLGQALVALCAAPGGADLFRVRLNAGVRG